jgi:hypothetical protein
MFIKERPRHIVKAGTSSLLIISYSTYIIKSILNGKNNKVNLILNNIVVIKGFHVNIIFKVLLYKKGIWYYRYNSTLRIRDKYKSSILLTITCIYNIIFIKYKPLLTYLNALFIIPTSISSILIYPILKRKIRESFRRSRKYL